MEKGGGTGIFSPLELPPSFLAASRLAPHSFSRFTVKEEQGTARSLLSLVIASLVNGKGSHVIYTRESGKI